MNQTHLILTKKIILLLALLCSIHTFSQISRFSIEANFPIVIGNNFFNENFDGIIDLGVKYRFVNTKIINIGTAINGGIFQNDTNLDIGINASSFTIQPRVFAELNLLLTKFRPFVALGYSFFIFNVDVANELNNFNDSDTQNGFNANFGFAYDILKKLFVQIQYNFITLTTDNTIPNTSFNRNLGIIKLGVGLRL